MSFLGKEIILKGISQKGKNKIKNFGEKWIVFAETDTILFSPKNHGPWLYVTPFSKNYEDKSSEWIRVTGDENFAIL
jgi:hypothetical protein